MNFAVHVVLAGCVALTGTSICSFNFDTAWQVWSKKDAELLTSFAIRGFENHEVKVWSAIYSAV